MPKGIPKSGKNKGWFKKGDKINLGKVTTEKTKQKLRKINIGRKHTKKVKKKIAQSSKKRWKNPEYKKRVSKKISEALKGKKCPWATPPHYRGSKNPAWKGGVTTENDKIRRSIEYRLWRESVFARDNWTCQECGKRKLILNAHHIKSFARNKKLRTSIENGVTLCRKCHIEVHKNIN